MYRIRTAQGTEAVYDSLEEFSVAVKRGAVSPDDEIFHTRAGRWLDIKSHPHYRSALTLNGGGGAPVAAGAAPSGPAQPRPTPSPAAPQPVQQFRPHMPDRPAPGPVQQQTTVRPQLHASPAPNGGAASFVPPQKSKDLTFINVDGSVVPPGSQRNATIVQVPRLAPKPTPQPSPAPASKPKPETKAPAAEADFLVMDGGIESPVRDSAGHRTVGDDLDLLFDAPLPPVEAIGAPPKPAAGPRSAEPAKPSAPAVATSAAAPAPKKEEKPVPPAAVASSTPVVLPKAVTAPTPVVTAARPALPSEAELDIPGGPLTAEEPAPSPQPPTSARLPLPLIAGGVAGIAIIGALLIWRPWQGSVATTEAAAQSAPVGSDSSGLVIPPAGYTGTVPGTTPAASGIKPVAAIGPQAASRIDSAAEAPDEEIIAAVRPNFRADAVISTADIAIGSADRGTPATAIPPSELARRAEAEERIAQQELAVRLGSAGFRSVLATSRLGSAEGAASARNAWAAGSDAIRQYRARIGRIEKAYEDSMLASQRAERWPAQELRAWGARRSLAEPGDVAQLADLMFSQITEALDLLAALSGQYEIKNELISFRSAGAETRYTSIRNWVEQRMHNWSATPESARPHSVTVILRALGDGLPAVK